MGQGMGHGFNRQWARELEAQLQQHGWGGRGGSGDWGGWGPRGRPSGPPPWLAGLFGLAGQDGPAPRPSGTPRRRAGGDPRGARRRAAERLPGDPGDLRAHRAVPGARAPARSTRRSPQLEDEGLVEGDDERGRRTLRLSDAGRAYLAEHADEVAAVWAPFAEGARAPARPAEEAPDFTSLKPEIGRVMNAVWQIISTGTDEQRRDAIGVLVEARRGLYRILADLPRRRGRRPRRPRPAGRRRGGAVNSRCGSATPSARRPPASSASTTRWAGSPPRSTATGSSRSGRRAPRPT